MEWIVGMGWGDLGCESCDGMVWYGMVWYGMGWGGIDKCDLARFLIAFCSMCVIDPEKSVPEALMKYVCCF